jgi:hypothetical protein
MTPPEELADAGKDECGDIASLPRFSVENVPVPAQSKLDLDAELLEAYKENQKYITRKKLLREQDSER